MNRIYDYYPNDKLPVDNLAISVALLRGAKIRAAAGQSGLDRPKQQLINKASAAIDEAVQALQSLRIAVWRDSK
jgi:hypothetical protein